LEKFGFSQNTEFDQPKNNHSDQEFNRVYWEKVIKQLTQEVIGLQKLKKIFQRLFSSASWFRAHNKFLDTYPFLILF